MKLFITFFSFIYLFCAPIAAQEPIIHVLIASIGNRSLFKMLEDLKQQLQPHDFLTVIFDARDVDHIYSKVDSFLKKFSCHCNLKMEPYNLGFWGHGIRNKYNHLSGDFILHADDDDIYAPGALQKIRQIIKGDLNALYIFKMSYGYNGRTISGNPIITGNISTQMGVIPAKYNYQASWGSFYGGDGAFYVELSKKIPKIIHVDEVLYIKLH